MPEKIPYFPSFSKKESRERFEVLDNYLEGLAQEFRDLGLPINPENFRLEASEYTKTYSPKDIQEDLEWLETKKQEVGNEEKEKAELFEKYICALFNARLGERIMVVRTTEYDDWFRHVDNIAVDRETGRAICTFDEIGVMHGRSYEKKRHKVLERNIGIVPAQGGANVKYGFTFKRTPEGESKVELTALKHVPIFYLALNPEDLERAVVEFNPSAPPSDFERKVLQYFLTSIDGQIQGLMLQEDKLHPQLKDSLLRFKAIIEEEREKYAS